MSQYASQEASIRRQQMIAKALRDSGNEGFDPGASAGRLVYARSPLEDLNRVAQQASAAYLDYRADKQGKELEATKTADARTRLGGMLDTLTGKSQNVLAQPNDPALSPLSGDANVSNPITGQSATVGIGNEMNQKRAGLAAVLKGMDPQAAAEMLQGKALDKVIGDPEKVDLGGQIGYVKDGKLVGTIDKSATKDAVLGADVSRYGINVGRENNILDNQTAVRGQNVSAETSRYATNVGASNNALDNETARANARLAADTALAGQQADRDIARAKLDAEIGAKGQKITVDERKAAYLATRLKNAQSVFDDLAKKNPDALGANWAAESVRGIPAVGEFAANVFSSSDRQRADAAQRDALDAAITLATGAAYTTAQLEAARRSHFNMPGDSDAVKAEKKARLDALVSAAELAAGAAGGNVAPVTDAFKATMQPAVKITSDAEYEALESGTSFEGPDGNVRVKP